MPRGSVKVFAPRWTELDPAGNRVARQSPRFAYRFWFGAVRYQLGGFETKRKALEAGEARKAEIRAGQEKDWRRYTLAALRELGDAHQETNADATKRNHANSWQRLLAFFPGGMLVHRVDDVQLHKYLKARRAKGFSDNSTKLDFAWLRKAMRLAHKKGLLPRVPDFPKLEYRRREQTFVPGELERVLQHMPIGYRLLFRAAEECGWRARSELTTRRWTDVDQTWLYVDAESTKAKKARKFPLTEVLRSILEEARAHVDSVQHKTGRIVPWVFVRENGRPIKSYRNAWQRALKLAGFGKLPGRKGAWSSARVPHDLRRGALRRWDRVNRLPEGTRMDLAGHSDAKTHALYLDQSPDEEALLAAARALDQQRSGAEPVTNVVQLELWKR